MYQSPSLSAATYQDIPIRCVSLTPNLDTLLNSMFNAMFEIYETVIELSEMKWGWVKQELNKTIQRWSEEGDFNQDEDASIDEDDEDNQPPEGDQSILNGQKIMENQLKSLYGQLEGYMTQIPVLGFNSGKYDINLIKQKLAMFLDMHVEEDRPFVVKKNNTYACISSKYYKFLDVMQFLAPGTSYAKFLKAYQVEEQKGFFPYEWFDDPEKLNHPELPPHEAFYSSLKQTNISPENYQFCVNVWRDNNMSTFEDFLVWYNNRDVGPFVTAVERLQTFYFKKNIDIFKIAISVPGITRRMLFQTAKEAGANFALFDKQNKDLYKVFKDNIIGGPSIIFTRYHKAGETRIRVGRPDLSKSDWIGCKCLVFRSHRKTNACWSFY
ncbi:Hypothetical predicted protein [Mytilus galloprovincialis]|uniref:Uncharacterized protein n=1 Tax=Mytilus galloprovincialis TaxID=29158 RepID=A0A8B6GSB6_MYTGA|nr:Hypothetical predicted protein [Mytilus galloprovincialis]